MDRSFTAQDAFGDLTRKTRLLEPTSIPWRGPLVTHVAVVFGLIVLGVAALSIDVRAAQLLVEQRVLRFADDFLEVFEPFGNAVAALVIAGGIAAASPQLRWAMPRLLAAAGGAGLAANVLKLCVARTRPYSGPLDVTVWETFHGLFPFLSGGSGQQSFPSAHVATATALGAALWTLFPAARSFFIASVAIVAWQRVQAGSHFASDVCWGAATGYLWCLALYRWPALSRLFDRIECGSQAGTPIASATSSNARDLPVTTAALTRQQLESAGVRSLSVVIPIFNELENVPRLHAALQPVLQSLPLQSEILFVDDGSRDGSDAALSALAMVDASVRVVTLRRNFGQTAAMSAGISHAAGDVIVLLDGDLQNDPEDIPAMLAEVVAGADLVHGWRRDRQDRWLDRKLPSMLANRLISRVTGFPIHDLGCTLKLVRREIAVELNLYGEMHRFIPILAHHRGARCKEIAVRHHPRQFGVSKYGLSRTIRVVLDLMTVVFLTQYVTSPMKLFGRLGVVSLGGGVLAGTATVAMKFVGGFDMTGNPLLLAAVFGSLLGMQFVCLGMLSEMAMRTYYAAQNMTSYAVRRRQNFPGDTSSEALPVSRFDAPSTHRRAA